MSSETPALLQPSELGTKSYWDDCYTAEITNHATNPEDEGTIWFSDSGAEEKMIDMLEEMVEAEKLFKDNSVVAATSICDLGTGNGHLLFSLRDDGWLGRMLGVDYSGLSVKLARTINEHRALKARDDNEDHIEVPFLEYDILSSEAIDNFDVLLDKGTFDAISLSADSSATWRYRDQIRKLLHTNGYLIITSCNWTELELRNWLEGDAPDGYASLRFVKRVNYPSFRFGGQDGQTVATICFQLVL